jgi:hypothetical protein
VRYRTSGSRKSSLFLVAQAYSSTSRLSSRFFQPDWPIRAPEKRHGGNRTTTLAPALNMGNWPCLENRNMMVRNRTRSNGEISGDNPRQRTSKVTRIFPVGSEPRRAAAAARPPTSSWSARVYSMLKANSVPRAVIHYNDFELCRRDGLRRQIEQQAAQRIRPVPGHDDADTRLHN